MITFKRKYVENYPSAWDDELISGYIYFENEPEKRFEDNLHIFKCDDPTLGKWLLRIERDEWDSDDLMELEDILMEWAANALYTEESCEVVEA